MDEYDMNWLRGRDYVEVTFPTNTREKNLLLKMAEEGVEGVVITAQNRDGSVVGHVPLKCVLFRRPPKAPSATAEELAARLPRFRGSIAQKTDENSGADDLPLEPDFDEI
jgi:hypothetical protein